MNKPTYQELLRDPRWQKRRLEVFQNADFMCQECGGNIEELHAHHLYYVPGRLPWEYPDLAFRCLCKRHHEQAHNGDTVVAIEKWLEAYQHFPLSESTLLRFFDFAAERKISPYDIIELVMEKIKEGSLVVPESKEINF